MYVYTRDTVIEYFYHPKHPLCAASMSLFVPPTCLMPNCGNQWFFFFIRSFAFARIS